MMALKRDATHRIRVDLSARSFSSNEISQHTVKELVALPRERGLQTSGKKQDLIDRLIAHDSEIGAFHTAPGTEAAAASDDATDALQYEKKSPVEHVLLRPDSYVGSMKPTVRRLAVLNNTNQSLVYRDVTFIPALLKIFDEILVNAADNLQRDPSMKSIDVVVDHPSGIVSVRNDGR